MFYSIISQCVRAVLWLVNGKIEVQNKEILPKDTNYIVIAPHRSLLDPPVLGLALSPQPIAFMAKKELFAIPILGWIIKKLHAFPVDRKNPDINVIKYPINILKSSDLCVGLFPSGTTTSDEAKDGAAVIARLSKKPIIPAVYQGPYAFKKLLTRQKMVVRFGKPFYIETKEDQKNFAKLAKQAFDQLEQEMNPDFKFQRKT